MGVAGLTDAPTELTDYSQPRESGLRITAPFLLGTIFTFLVAATTFFLGAKVYAAVIMGIWAFFLVAVSPRAGLILLISTQVIDIVLNPAVAI